MKFLYTLILVLFKNLLDFSKVLLKGLRYTFYVCLMALAVFLVFTLIGHIELMIFPNLTDKLFGLNQTYFRNNALMNEVMSIFATGILTNALGLIGLIGVGCAIWLLKIVILEILIKGSIVTFNLFIKYIVDKWKWASRKAEFKFSIYR